MKKTFGLLVLKVFSAGLTYVANAVITHYLNAKEAGLYFLFSTIIILFTGVNRLGLDYQSVQMVAIHNEKKEVEFLKQYIFNIFLIIGLVSCLLYIPVAVIAFFTIKNVLSIFLIGIALFFYSLKDVLAAILRGIQQYYGSGFIQNSSTPMIVIVFFGYALLTKNHVNPYLIYTFSVLFPTIWGVVLLRRNKIWDWKLYPVKIRGLLPMINWNKYFLALLLIAINWLPNLLVGASLNVESIAIFNVINRTAIIISFIYIAVESYIGPKIAIHHNNNEQVQLEKLLVKMSKLSFLVSTAITLVAVIFSQFVMKLFGPLYAKNAGLFAIMAIAQYMNVLSGSAATFMIMTHREKIVRNVYFVTVVAILISLPLVSYFKGLEGATITYAAIMIGYNLVLTAIAKLKFGIRVSFLVPKFGKVAGV